MIATAQNKIAASGDCEVHFDDLTRQLYATDASIYEIKPFAVAFPRNANEASAIIAAAAGENISVTPRGAGTSLSGGAIGEGLVVDFSRYNRQITELNLEERSVRVGAGVVLDQLNAFLRPHGFCFGPDVATSSRATIGGMVANNSSGARVPVYGTTADHVLGLELVLADSRIAKIGPKEESLRPEQNRVAEIVQRHAAEISDRWPPGLLKRWPGYGLDRFLRRGQDLNAVLAGSEGTLAAIFSATLQISPLPREKGLALIFFASVGEAMTATVELLDLAPAAIEHVDRALLDQTRGQLHFQRARDLMELDTRPCQSILLVEFYDDIADKLAALQSKNLGLRAKVLTDAAEMNSVWSVRKAGLSLLTGCVGPAKPVAFIEDAAVRPAQLPAYVAGLQSIMHPLGLEASYYGHAAAGLLHVRPVLDLHEPRDLQKFRQVADQTSALVRQFKGSLSAEHGVGIARTEYMPEQLGDELLGAMREIKYMFDPKNVFNPGKIFSDGRHRIDRNLRQNFSEKIQLDFQPRLSFAFKDRSFIGNLEQCNGCGGCRKDAPMMCPTYLATGEEVMSTRGRANIIRAALQMRVGGHDPLRSRELDAALSNCLSCKGCTPECPSNVNLALLKAELMYARHRRDGLPLRERILSNVDWLGRLGCAVPGIANASLDWPFLRRAMEKTLGISAKRSLPNYSRQRFDHWFTHRPTSHSPGFKNGEKNRAPRGKVILWDDTFVRYNEPHIGIAAVQVLEKLGFDVALLKNRQCCGRPAFSQGNLDLAAKFGRHNIDLLLCEDPNVPIVFLEPSCWSMFVEDYRELGLRDIEAIVPRSVLFEQLVAGLLDREPDAVDWHARDQKVAIHAHCHAKSIIKPHFMTRLVGQLPGRQARLLDTGCCGMAGSFGMLARKYELSVLVARDLIDKIDRYEPDVLIASGTSCRHQIADLTSFQPKHMAELVAEAIA